MMIRVILLVFCLFYGERNGVLEALPAFIVYPSKVHHFSKVYEQIRSHEGCYVFDKRDRGGETYGGIARKIHPQWMGWEYVDEAKPLERFDTVARAEFWVKDWYLDIWIHEGFENIESYDLALNLFDFRIHSSPRTVELFTNRVLVKMGCDPVTIGEDWIDNRFNQVDVVEFTLRLKIQRILLFNYIVTRHPDQKVFYGGWVSRVSNI